MCAEGSTSTSSKVPNIIRRTFLVNFACLYMNAYGHLVYVTYSMNFEKILNFGLIQDIDFSIFMYVLGKYKTYYFKLEFWSLESICV